MAGTNGFNFVASRRAKASDVNSNFDWVRGHYLPITQSSVWANTTGVYDIGSSSFKWRDAYISGSITTKDLTVANTHPITVFDPVTGANAWVGRIGQAGGRVELRSNESSPDVQDDPSLPSWAII